MAYITSWERDGMDKVLQLQLARKFGAPLNRDLSTKIQTLEPARLDQLAEDLLDFTAEEDLVNWLNSKENPRG